MHGRWLINYSEFFYSLDRNRENIDAFYNKKYSETARRVKLLQDQYGWSIENPTGLDRDDAEDLVGALLELRGQLRKLQWYGEVNRRGFVKITKKLDKRVPQHDQPKYVETKVDILPFATNSALMALTQITNDWLSKLGDVKVKDDSSSTHSMQDLPRVSIKSMMNLPQQILDTVEQAIRSDDAAILMEVLQQATVELNGAHDTQFQKLLQNLLQRAISCRSQCCIGKLLADISTLDEPDDINQRNVLHRFVISLSRSKLNDGSTPPEMALEESISNANFIIPATAPSLTTASRNAQEADGTKWLGKTDKSILMLNYILDEMKESQRPALQARDSLGRMPLHYSAQCGYVVMVQDIITRMQQWGQFEISYGVDAPFWQDSDGYSPLGLAILEGHTKTTQALLAAEQWRAENEGPASVSKRMGRSGQALLQAVKQNLPEIVKLLVDSHVNLDFQDSSGETALHVAARYGHVKCAELLLAGTPIQKSSTDVTEKTFAWTPLHLACVDGQLEMVKLLIDAKADLLKKDSSGWTAKEHAALRGHVDIATMLAGHTPTSPALVASRSRSPANHTSLEDSKSHGTSSSLKRADTVKSFGHRYLTDETLVLVSLGSMDTRKNLDAINLDKIPIADAHSTQLDTALSLIVSASGATGEPMIVDLPVEDNISTEPVSFHTKDITKVKVLFDLVPTYAGSKDNVIGRAVAMLSSIKPGLGSKRITLQGDIVVPVIGAKNLEVIGSVNFNFLIITPFKHPNMTITENHTYWKSMTSTTLIGHRGLGKNVSTRSSLQLGENTLQSFIAAANLGANYVEFDVQLTKDLVPVIYHDFLVSETGIDAPVHTLTLEQFLHVSNVRSRQQSRAPSPEHSPVLQARKQRSASLSNVTDNFGQEMNERMKHTRDFKSKGFKGNSRGASIQAPFTTLEEMFRKLPENTGFNIEMKYPMLFESEEQEMDTYAVELNSFVDTVLKMVYDFAGKRNVIFSSFNPDVCLLLSFKQPSIPILFLTDAGTNIAGDVRASSLQEAIRFASRWNLLGVVSAAQPLVLCPRLVKVVKESGLVCVSYGSLNNDPKNVAVSTSFSQLTRLKYNRSNSIYSCRFKKASMP